MWHKSISFRQPLSLVWPLVLLATAALAGLWLWLAGNNSVQVLLASALLAVTVTLGIVWQSRARAARRLQAVVDAYAERQIAGTSRGNAPKRTRTSSPRRAFANPSSPIRLSRSFTKESAS
jgi:predicted membrane metal-binding protein